MNAPNYRLGWFALLTIMALRVGVGMHFYGEGAKKLDKQKPFTSQYFLAAAKGPLAEHYHKMIWDKDGVHRLLRGWRRDFLGAELLALLAADEGGTGPDGPTAV